MKILKVVDSLNMKLSNFVAYVKDDYKGYPNAFTIDSEEDEYNIVVRHV